MPRNVIISMLLIALMGGCSTLSGCQSFAVSQKQTLYEQLGERAGIAKIVEDLLYKIVEDTRINHQFKGIGVAQFHKGLTDKLCALSGGPCTYKGRGMRKLHESMAISDTEFNALVENLILAMEQNHVPTGAQNRLLKKLIPLYSDIRNL